MVIGGGGAPVGGLVARAGLGLATLMLACCAALPVLPQETPRVPADLQPIALPGPDGVTLRALLAMPPAGAPRRPAIIALHGCAGLAPPDRPLVLPAREADWAARLTEAGHPVLFPDSFGSRGSGGGCGVPDFPINAEVVRREDARAAAAWVAGQPWAMPGGAILFGWSHGGSTTLAAVAEPLPPGLVRAAVAFYSGCVALVRAGGWKPAVPLLMLHGSRDTWTSPSNCRLLASADPARAEFVAYAGATHDFDHLALPFRSRVLPDGRSVTMGTDATARADALVRVAGFLAAHGGDAR